MRLHPQGMMNAEDCLNDENIVARLSRYGVAFLLLPPGLIMLGVAFIISYIADYEKRK